MATCNTKRVSFTATAKLRTISKLTEQTPKSSLWYTREDFELIQFQCKKVLKNEKRGCIRGLEGRTASGSYNKRMNRYDVQDAVFRHQEEQRENGTNDPEIIAEASRQMSQTTRDEAHLIGLLDERFVVHEQQRALRHIVKEKPSSLPDLVRSPVRQPRRRSIAGAAA